MIKLFFHFNLFAHFFPRLEVGVSTMRKGEVSQFLVKSEYAFGRMGCPPRIPPEATSKRKKRITCTNSLFSLSLFPFLVLFEVELLSFVDHSAADNYDDLPDEQKSQVGLKELVDVANAEREVSHMIITC